MGNSLVGNIVLATVVKRAKNIVGRNTTKRFLTDSMNDGLRLAPASEAIGDTWHFTMSDQSLNPDFLQSLLEIKGEPIEKAQEIVSRILKSMGYENSKVKVLIEDCGHASAAFDELRGTFLISEKAMKACEELPILIALLRHEAEHLDQFVKLYKALGKDAFVDLMKTDTVEKPIQKIVPSEFPKKFLPKKNLSDIFLLYVPNSTSTADIKKVDNKTIEKFRRMFGEVKKDVKDRNLFESKCPQNINFEFYETMSQQVSLQNFDVAAISQGVKNYTHAGDTMSSIYEYIHNPLEDAAYNVQRKVLSCYGKNATLYPDVFPKNYEKLLELMGKNGIDGSKQEDLLMALNRFISINSMEWLNNKEALLGFLKKVLLKQELTPKEQATINEFMKNTQVDAVNKVKCQQKWLEVEQLFSEGHFSIEELLTIL